MPGTLIPTLETERLVLRGWRDGDLDAYFALLSDPQVARFIAGATVRADAWRAMAIVAGHWIDRGYGFWAVERKEDGAMLGRVGLWNPDGWPAIELGWAIARAHWGKGYATEAGRAAMDHSFRTLSIHRLVCHIQPANSASQAVARRLGIRRGPRSPFLWSGTMFDVDAWEITRAEWEAPT